MKQNSKFQATVVILTRRGRIFNGQSWWKMMRKRTPERCVFWGMWMLDEEHTTITGRGDISLLVSSEQFSFLELPKPLCHCHHLLFLNYFLVQFWMSFRSLSIMLGLGEPREQKQKGSRKGWEALVIDSLRPSSHPSHCWTPINTQRWASIRTSFGIVNRLNLAQVFSSYW